LNHDASKYFEGRCAARANFERRSTLESKRAGGSRSASQTNARAKTAAKMGMEAFKLKGIEVGPMVFIARAGIIRRLQLELVSKEQDIMDLRNKVKR
jgi:hypothetical protein